MPKIPRDGSRSSVIFIRLRVNAPLFSAVNQTEFCTYRDRYPLQGPSRVHQVASDQMTGGAKVWPTVCLHIPGPRVQDSEGEQRCVEWLYWPVNPWMFSAEKEPICWKKTRRQSLFALRSGTAGFWPSVPELLHCRRRSGCC